MNALPIVGDICACPESSDLESYPKGFTCEKEYTSAGYSSSGKKIKAESGLTFGSSDVSQEAACEQALERAQERAAELLRLKYFVTSQITGFGQDNYYRIAPLGIGGSKRWEGVAKKKQSEYRVTAMIPHLETIEPLWIAIELLRRQTERPYIIVVDTGSSWRTMEMLERMRADDLEIHYVRSNAYRHSSAPVAVAMDLAHSVCSTEFILHTHSDVFVRRDDLIEDLLRICNKDVPAVGYQMSERSWVTPEWEGMIGHTLAMFHLPTIEKSGATWSMERTYRADLELPREVGGWPDTETGFNRILKNHGIKPFFIGDDQNYIRQVDRNIDHVRSYPGSQAYADEYFKKAEGWMLDAMKEALERLSLMVK